MSSYRSVLSLGIFCSIRFVLGVVAENDRPAEAPMVVVASPLGLILGSTNELKLRGTGLTNIIEVKADPNVTLVEVKNKGASKPPEGLNAKNGGDSHLDLGISLPIETNLNSVSFLLSYSNAPAVTYALPVFRPEEIMDEKEPNNGFRNAQPASVKRWIRGRIDVKKDVDVYELKLKAGDRLKARIESNQRGAALDAVITAYKSNGHAVAVSDDVEDRDPSLIYRVEQDGTYFLSVQDAHDRGGEAHSYLLWISTE